jgi:Protein of unknown function (DUF2852)
MLLTFTKRFKMSALARLNEWEHPRPIWILLLILSFWVSWPVGVVLFAYLMWSGRLEGWKRAGLNLWNEGIGPMRQAGTGWPRRSSGNNAFDEYRADTLRRLEDEKKEFQIFLDRLRAAKDRAEFDQFMSERGNRVGNPTAAES